MRPRVPFENEISLFIDAEVERILARAHTMDYFIKFPEKPCHAQKLEAPTKRDERDGLEYKLEPTSFHSEQFRKITANANPARLTD